MLADFDLQAGRLNFSNPELPDAFVRGGNIWVNYRLTGTGRLQRAGFIGGGSAVDEQPLEDLHGSGRQRVIHCPRDAAGLELTYRINSYDHQPFVLLQLSILNLSSTPVYLDQACLLQAAPSEDGLVQLSQSDEGLRFFKVGWHGWDYTGLRRWDHRESASWLDRLTSLSYTNPVTHTNNLRGEISSEGWAILAGKEAGLVAGFVSTAHQFGQVVACLRPGAAAFRLVTQLDGIRLAPGEIRDSEWGFLQLIKLPDPEPAADFVAALSRQMAARLPASPPPPMWTHWYQFYHNISEQLFVQNLESLIEKRDQIPYQVVELDDGYQSAWGDWLATNSKFPHGLSWLAEQVRIKGFTPGLWLSPFVVEAKSTLAIEHSDWLVKNRNGKPANAGFVYNKFLFALDLTHPAVQEHLFKLSNQLAKQWGFSLLKIDFLNAGALPGVRYDPGQTRAEALRAGLEAIRQGAGEESFLLGCGCPFGPAIGVVDAMRIGPDTVPAWEPYLHWLPWVSPFTKKNPSMPSLRNALRHTLNLNSLHQRLWWNDPDCLMVRDTATRLTEAEVQSAVTLVGLSGGLLVSSDDMRLLSPERLRWVSLLVPNLGLRGLPLDLLEHEMPGTYRVKLNQAGQTWQLLGLFNWEDHPADLHLHLSELGFRAGTDLHVFEFWTRNVLRTQAAELVFKDVPPHGCKLLRLCEFTGAPQLVGDSLHISQGAECSSLRIADDRLLIDTFDMGRQVDGDLWFWLPIAPRKASCNAISLQVDALGGGIYRLHLRFMSWARIEIAWDAG